MTASGIVRRLWKFASVTAAIVLIATALAGVLHQRAGAQTGTGNHAIVGFWQFGDYEEPLFSYGFFSPDGTYVEDSKTELSIGMWRAVDDKTVELYVMSQDTNPDMNIYEAGHTTLFKTLHLSDDGSRVDGSYVLDVRDLEGAQLFGATWPIFGTRVQFPEETTT
jgi:hypothetical protein